MLLSFAQNIIFLSGEKIDILTNDEIDIFFLPSITAEEAAYLAVECIKLGKDGRIMDFCFVIAVNTGGASCGATLETAFTGIGQDAADITTSGTGNVLYYHYQDPGKVFVECN